MNYVLHVYVNIGLRLVDRTERNREREKARVTNEACMAR